MGCRRDNLHRAAKPRLVTRARFQGSQGRPRLDDFLEQPACFWVDGIADRIVPDAIVHVEKLRGRGEGVFRRAFTREQVVKEVGHEERGLLVCPALGCSNLGPW